MSKSHSNSMTNALIIMPSTYKQQLIYRIGALLQNQRNRSYSFDENSKVQPTVFGYNVMTIESYDNGRGLTATTAMPADTPRDHPLEDFSPQLTPTKIDATQLFIEQLFDIYVGLQDIYETKFQDYSAIV